MCRHRSKTTVHPAAALGLSLALAVWVGVLAPFQAVVCPHGGARPGVTHEAGLCAWSCAAHQQGQIQAAQPPIETPPETGRVEPAPVDVVAVVQLDRALARGPPPVG